MIHWLLGYVVLARLVELAWAARNTRRLRAAGAVEVGAGHYPAIVLLHAAWIVALATGIPAETPIRPEWLALFALLQGARLWVIVSLGRFWTTRIMTLPGTPLIRRGPYRWIRHPNYLVVALEIPSLPLAFGAWGLALAFGLANLIVLAWRIRAEDGALAARRAAG